ncbi:MAG: hypothetical protein COV31_01550 [Candidatus Yanofskybacteria bacterium CG10_big_fil_rev_8_21_14_0_10_46_23]|uniref:R3H domain-containing protein n=1 Tax=Candidatus Yanofskybacteria bacterium CG10_big_fil_rev_8_21_14_0_10_46_23 TaxID=1975098 RepID=A0A2H0R5Q9_9BACT|nr:MAG: hypothetical protein COV31_01550 [Candidatus Yanofskybacteria bacterium CG10_big_fil_rev_8_21_14_0_10_46_23]
MSKEHDEKIIETTQKIMDFMKIQAGVSIQENDLGEDKIKIVNIEAPTESGALIGKNGQTIQSLEHVIRLIAKKGVELEANFIIDVNNYRKSRVDYLVNYARGVAAEVKNTHRAKALFPMPAHERRIVHMELAAHGELETESVGEEPRRRIVIRKISI